MSFDVVHDRIEELGLFAGPAGWDGNEPFRCPAHEDNSPSASIKEADDGKVLLHCHAGCDPAEIVRELGVSFSELFPDDPEPRIVAEYFYTDEDDVPLIRVQRWEPGRSGGKKDFSQSAWINDRWAPRLGDARRVLYNLPRVLEATSVFIVEGEKDADRLQAHLDEHRRNENWAATTTIGGAGKRWDPEWTKALVGKRITVIADADPPGVAHAGAIYEALHVVAEVEVRYPAAGKDVSDHLDAGLVLDQLLTRPPAAQDVAGILTPADLKPPPEWVYEPLFYDRSLIWLFGPSGHGKSIALDWVMTDMSRRGQAVLLYDWEDAQLELSRLMAMGGNFDHIRLRYQHPDNPTDLSTPELRDLIRSDIDELDPRLIIFNTFTTMYRDVGGTDAWNEAVREVGSFLKPLVAETGAAIVVVDHQENAEAVHAHGGRSKKSWSDQYLKVTQDQQQLYDGGGEYRFKVESLKQSRRAIKPVTARVTGRLEEKTLHVEWNPWEPTPAPATDGKALADAMKLIEALGKKNVGDGGPRDTGHAVLADGDAHSVGRAGKGSAVEATVVGPSSPALPLMERLALRRLQEGLGATEVAE